MLPKKHRLRSAAGFSATVRSGARLGRRNVVLYAAIRADAAFTNPSRYGFIVSKAVGNAVTRNLVKRRLRAIAAEHLATADTGFDIVLRALPASAYASWSDLSTETRNALDNACALASKKSAAAGRKGHRDA